MCFLRSSSRTVSLQFGFTDNIQFCAVCEWKKKQMMMMTMQMQMVMMSSKLRSQWFLIDG